MNITTQKVGVFDVITLTGEFLTEPEQNAFRSTVRSLIEAGARHVIEKAFVKPAATINRTSTDK